MVAQVQASTIRVDIRGNSQDMVAATQRATASLRRHEETARRTTRAWRQGAAASNAYTRVLGRLAAAFGAGLLIRRFAQAAGNAAQFGATLQETAVSVGATVQELQVLDRVARSEGVQFNTLARSLQRLDRALAEGAAGVGEYQRAFETLGLDAQALLDLPVAQRLLVISEALNRINTAAERSSLAQQLLGRGGASLIPALGGGAEDLEARIRTAEQIATLTAEQTADLKALDQAWTDFTDTTRVATRLIVASFADLLTEGLDFARRVAASIGNIFSAPDPNASETVDVDAQEARRLVSARQVQAAADQRLLAQRQEAAALDRLIRGEETRLRALEAETRQINLSGAALLRDQFIQRATTDLLNRRARLQQQIAQQQLQGNPDAGRQSQLQLDAVNQQLASIERLADTQQGVFEAQARYTAQLRHELQLRPAILEAVREEQSIGQRAVQGLRERVAQSRLELQFRGRITAESERANFILRTRGQLQQRLLEAQRQLVASEQIQNVEQRQQSRAVAQARIAAIQEEQGGLNELADNYRSLFEEIERNNALAAQLQRIQQVSDQVGDSLGRFAASAVQNFNNISDAARDTALAIADIILQQTVQRPIAGFISQGISSLAGSVIPSLFGSPAAGNAIAGGVRPGGATVVNNYNISGSDEATVRRGIAQAAPSLSQSAVNRVGIEASRPSALRSSLAAG